MDMPEKGVRSTFSQCPFQLLMTDEAGLISTGTGFFYAVSDDWFLITNWHNVSGKDFLTGKCLSASRRLPVSIKARFSTYISDIGGVARPFTTVAQQISIYANGEPTWFEHPILGANCDVVALPVRRPSTTPNFMHNAANRISNVRIPVKPGNIVFIIGFPRAISVGFGLPIWKSGFIASEPHYDVTIGGQVSDIGGMAKGTRLPAFFVDSLTREGLSGSPVFAAYAGTWDTTDPYRPVDPDAPDYWNRNDIALGHSAMEFVGIYSGRIKGNVEEAALGLCWREDVIREICVAKKLGSHPHVAAARVV